MTNDDRFVGSYLRRVLLYGIVVAARLSRRAAASVAGSLFAAMVGMWWLFASSDSSTSALIFLWGWFAGVPIAAGVVTADRRRASGTALASTTSN